jgi:hypothetical protein
VIKVSLVDDLTTNPLSFIDVEAVIGSIVKASTIIELNDASIL